MEIDCFGQDEIVVSADASGDICITQKYSDSTKAILLIQPEYAERLCKAIEQARRKCMRARPATGV